jgi:uncharacterized delta-60 repeat protein
MAVARYNADGTPDSGAGTDSTPADSFGSGGATTVQIGPNEDGSGGAAIQADGKIVLGGYSKVVGGSPGDRDLALARFTPEGNLDDSGPGAFSGDGKLTMSLGTQGDTASRPVVQPDGKLVVTGRESGAPTTPVSIDVLRFMPDGTLDPAFDFDGIVSGPSGEFASPGAPTLVGEKILVPGYLGTPADALVARYHQDDLDSDGVADGADNCPTTPNPGQENLDGDAEGDVCDGDDDDDGVADAVDPAPTDPSVPGAPPGPQQPPGGPSGPTGPTDGDDVLNGTPLADRICGLLGNDTINGLAGNDTLFGDACNDKLRPALGATQLADGNDTLNGGPGNDKLFGAGGRDRLDGGKGDDRLSGGGGKDRLDGGKGNDTLSGGASRNSYEGGSGNDTLSARNGVKETVDCGPGSKDRATVDRSDAVKGCESVKRPKK